MCWEQREGLKGNFRSIPQDCFQLLTGPKRQLGCEVFRFTFNVVIQETRYKIVYCYVIISGLRDKLKTHCGLSLYPFCKR